MRPFLLVFSLCLAARADWEGKVRFTHDPPRKAGGSEGAIHAAKGRVRVEEPTPLGRTVLLFDGRRLRVLFPERKQFSELDAKLAPAATVPPLSLKGMQKVGAEVLEGRATTIWESRQRTQMGEVRQRLWVPDDAKELIFLRFVTQTDRGATRADVGDLRVRPQPAALFRVPAGYEKKK
jgi:hypothetical protein